jgi:hypothetical protein
LDSAKRAVREGRPWEELTALERLPHFTHFGGTFSRLALGLGLAYYEVSSGR